MKLKLNFEINSGRLIQIFILLILLLGILFCSNNVRKAKDLPLKWHSATLIDKFERQNIRDKNSSTQKVFHIYYDSIKQHDEEIVNLQTYYKFNSGQHLLIPEEQCDCKQPFMQNKDINIVIIILLLILSTLMLLLEF